MDERKPAPPSGLPPPTTAHGPDGQVLDLVMLAAEACAQYHAEYPDEDGRYGDVGQVWCRHDIQHLLSWAALDVEGLDDLDREVTWLAGILEAREFPLDRLARGLDLAAEMVRRFVEDCEPVAVVLEGSARMVRERGSFLD